MTEIIVLDFVQVAPAVALASPSWSPLWIELPLLIPEVALIVVAAIAMFRARPEDVPRVFAAFGVALGRLVRTFFGLLPARPSLPESDPDQEVEKPSSMCDDGKDGD